MQGNLEQFVAKGKTSQSKKRSALEAKIEDSLPLKETKTRTIMSEQKATPAS
jgi:hypothetical protein